MRILIINFYYPSYLEQVKKKILPHEGTYQELLDKLFYDSFSWADFYSDEFRKLGHESFDIVHNFTELQDLYAKENGLNKTGLELLTEQVKEIKPDILYLDTLNVPPTWVKHIREVVPQIKKVGIFNCSPGSANGEELFKICDFVITCNEHIHQKYKQQGLNSFHVFHAFDPKVLKRIKVDRIKAQLVFTGSLIAGSDFHSERMRILEGLVLQNLPFTAYASYDKSPKWKVNLKRNIFLTAKALAYIPGNPLALWPKFRNVQNTKNIPTYLKLSNQLRAQLKEPRFGNDMYQALAESLITFNIHGGISGNYSANMRLFEATGVGSCLLTDTKADLHKLFDKDNEIVTYSSVEECLEKVNWLLQNPQKAKEIASAGQKRTLSHHTYKQRAPQLIDIFKA